MNSSGITNSLSNQAPNSQDLRNNTGSSHQEITTHCNASTSTLHESLPLRERKLTAVQSEPKIDQIIDAVRKRNSETLKMLLKDEQMIAELNNYGTVTKDTPLILAVKQADNDLISLLINNGADVTAPDTAGEPPFHIAARIAHNAYDDHRLFRPYRA